MWQVYEALASIPNGNFTVAAAFGNVHGVYAPGNVSLKPVILHNTQKYIKENRVEDLSRTFGTISVSPLGWRTVRKV